MRTPVVTEEMEATAREVLGFPHFRPGASVPSCMRYHEYRKVPPAAPEAAPA